MFEFGLPNGEKLRVVRDDIMNAALHRNTTDRHLLERSEALGNRLDTFSLIKMLLRGRQWTPRQASELHELIWSGAEA